MIDKTIDVALQVAKTATKLLAVMVLVGLLFMAWFALTFYIWGNFGSDTMQWWFVISALLVSIMLVALW